MNVSRMFRAGLAAVWLVGAAPAAPVPVGTPASQGPLSDFLRLRDKAMPAAPLEATPAVLAEEGILALERRGTALVTVERTVTEMVTRAKEVAENVPQPGGRVVTVKRIVMEMVPVTRRVTEVVQQPGGKVVTVRVPVKSCRFFTVSKEGKLEALEAEKATALLKKKTTVLVGESAAVEARSLESLKPGTLCVIPPPAALPAPPAPPDDKPKN